MVKIKVWDDGKEKWQSFEAWVPDLDNLRVEYETGYGEDTKEAIQECLKVLKDTVAPINETIAKIEAGNYIVETSAKPRFSMV